MRFWYVICLVILSSCAYKHEDADLVIHNAIIYTCDGNFTKSQAIAIKDGIILEVGPERQIRNKYSADKEIDNRTRPIYPVFPGSQNPIKDFERALKDFQIEDGADRKDVLLTLTRFQAIQDLTDENNGSLEKGKLANYFITNGDLMTTPIRKLSQLKIVEIQRSNVAIED